MNEQCAGCPWLDEPKKQCRRTPPRFCSVDEAANARPVQEILPPAEKRDESQTKIHRAA
jgi:hypothetical protein